MPPPPPPPPAFPPPRPAPPAPSVAARPRTGMGPGMWMALLVLVAVMGVGARLTLRYSNEAAELPTWRTPAAGAPVATAAPAPAAADRGGVRVPGGAGGAKLSPSLTN